METLMISLDLKAYQRNGKPPQLGITVEAPYATALKQQRNHHHKQQAAKDYSNHDYLNFDHLFAPDGAHSPPRRQPNTGDSAAKQEGAARHQVGYQHGLQITQIQEDSVIDRCGQFKIGDIIIEVNGFNLQRRTFCEAQKTLKEFVVRHSSHGPLRLKVLRRATSSSSASIPSTTGSQATVIEINDLNQQLSPTSSSTSTPRKSHKTQQEEPALARPTGSTGTSNDSDSPRHLVGTFNTRRIGTKHRISLSKSKDGGFGIKIAERDNMFGCNRPIYVTAITTTGSAFRDGRLKEGDMLLEINGIDLSGKTQPEVTKMLKAIDVGEMVEFLVSRQEMSSSVTNEQPIPVRADQPNNPNAGTENDNYNSLIDLDGPIQDDVFTPTKTDSHQFEQRIDNLLNLHEIDGPGTYVYDIPINDTKSAGLGLYLKYPMLERKDLGIWIEKVITGGAAWKDGRLQPDDQILAINGIDLVGLSNNEASETLTAATSRGIGPEAAPNTIRLHILRRDKSVVAKILQGTNNRIEHSDMQDINNGLQKSELSDKLASNFQQTYQSSMNGAQPVELLKASSTDSSSSSSNQNSQNDSALSPQTQASNSLKFVNLSNDKSDQNSSDRTNDTSSAISQITDYTAVPMTENMSPDKDSGHVSNENTNSAATTLPKSLDLEQETDSRIDNAPSTQSLDEESLDSRTGEEIFQRDGFGRQSISEKRHAQFLAQNSDTFRRNQKAREERERMKKLEQQLERQRLDDCQVIYGHNHKRAPGGHNTAAKTGLNSVQQKYQISDAIALDGPGFDYGREVPVDVHVPVSMPSNVGNAIHQNSNHYYAMNDREGVVASQQRHVTNASDSAFGQSQCQVRSSIEQCLRCGLFDQCTCHYRRNVQPEVMYGGINYGFDPGVKRSSSLESVQRHHNQQHQQLLQEGIIIPKAGTVRVARNRKINESFRAAVDRSYDNSMNDSARVEQSNQSQSQGYHTSPTRRLNNTVSDMTRSTFDDRRYLIKSTKGNNIENCSNTMGNNAAPAQKKSSLLSKFFKFGSIKKIKRKMKEQANVHDQQTQSKTVDNSKSRRELDTTTRSQSGKNTHTKSQSSQLVHKADHNIQLSGMNSDYSLQNMNTMQQSQSQHVMSGHQIVKPTVQTDGTGSHYQQPYQHQRSSLQMRFPQQQQQVSYGTHGGPIIPNQHAVKSNHLNVQVTPLNNQSTINVRPAPSDLMSNPQYSQYAALHNQLHHTDSMQPTVYQQQLPSEFRSHGNDAGYQQYQAMARNQKSQPPNVLNMGMSNGIDHIATQWHQQPPTHTQAVHHAPSGLWVANSPPNEGIYDANHRRLVQPAVSLSHPAPFIPNFNQSLGVQHHTIQPQAHIMQDPTQAPMTQQILRSSNNNYDSHHHHQQPQHIYYYDF